MENAEQVEATAAAMVARIEQLQPDARIDGLTVQEMVHWPAAHELIAGATTDPIFGPVVLFGRGGTAVEIIADRAVSLPPLNMALAREFVSRTRVAPFPAYATSPDLPFVSRSLRVSCSPWVTAL